MKKKPTREERELGLDPNLYTKELWNPAKFISPPKEEKPVEKPVEENSQKELQKLIKEMTAKNDIWFFGQPHKQQLIKDLGLEVSDGLPVFSMSDLETIEDYEDYDPDDEEYKQKLTQREKMLLDLMWGD